VNISGEEFYVNTTVPFEPFDWLNDSTVVGISQNKIHSRLIPNGELNLLNSVETSVICDKFYNKDKNTCYINKRNNPMKLLQYSLSGDNNVDTIKSAIASHKYFEGDFVNDKFITTLARQEWANLTGNVRFFRSNVLIMNSDGSDERLIEIPE